jgi:hypothetical protein
MITRRSLPLFLIPLIALTVSFLCLGQQGNFPPSSGGGTTPNTSLPLATSGPGPVFNVANYTGAFHDSRSIKGCDTSISATQVTCPVVAGVTPFTTADLTKRINCADGVNGNQYPQGTTITGIVSGTVAQLSSTRTGANVGQKCTFGHPDDVALVASFAAALAQSTGVGGQATGNAGVNTAAPTLYLPAGGWMVCTPSSGIPIFNFTANRKGFTIRGDGQDQTFLYNCDNTTAATGAGFWINNANMTDLYLDDFTIDGGFLGWNTGGNNDVISSAIATYINNVHVQAIRAAGGVAFSGGYVKADNLIIDTTDGNGLLCNNCSGEFHNWSVSNSNQNISIQNVLGLNVGLGLHFWGGLVDEGGAGLPVTQIINSQDIWFVGTAGFGSGNAYAMSVDGKSFVHVVGGIWGVFGNDGNAGGISIAAGGLMQSSDARFVSSGTRNCIANLGQFNNNGGNSCETMFQIVSGTSTGTAAVLTVTPNSANVSTNCTAGDALQVEGASIAGYNGYFPAGATSGITAVGTNTISYTTQGATLGALGAGGVAFCRNMQTYSGNFPKALITPSVTNFTEGVVNLAASTVGTWTPDRGIIINRIQATNSAGNVTCATPLVLQVSNGTSTQSLTLTSGQSTWDSGAGTFSKFFIGNTAVTVSQTATAACAVPPVNLNISIYWWAGLDN